MKQVLFLNLQYRYVKSHQDNFKDWKDLPMDQWLNVICDTLAKQAIGRGLAYELVTRVVKPLSLPYEQASSSINGIKLT